MQSDCPIPRKPSEQDIEIIKQTIPIKELISEFKFDSRSALSQSGGGFSKKQRAIAHVLAVITSLLIGGVGAAAIYYSLYYSGLLQWLWPAFDAAEKAFQGCGSIAGTTGRWALGKITMGYVPDCNEIHLHFDKMLESFYAYVSGTNITIVYASGGYNGLVNYYLDLLYGGSCDIDVRKSTKTLQYSKRSSSTAPAAGGGGRKKKEYKTLGNGYRVIILNDSAEVQINGNRTVTAKRVFIGKSPRNNMTNVSKNYGKKFDGNSILIEVGTNEYIFVGSSIMKFQSKSKIIEFVSPVGNMNVPYPFAVDDNGNYYLFNLKVIAAKIPKKYQNDPYDFMYYNTLIEDKDIVIGNKQYPLRYVPYPAKEYTEMAKMSKNIQIKGSKLTKTKYIKLIEDFGKKMGFSLLKSTNL